MNKSHLTAIVRKTLPLPTRWLIKERRIIGDVLDYGCGRCHEVNNKHFRADGYDPHYRPDGIKKLRYDTIICNYVLNVIEDPVERAKVLAHIESLLTPAGYAYISVRNDIDEDHVSSRGTWQGVIDLPTLFPLRETVGYKMYLTKQRYYAPTYR